MADGRRMCMNHSHPQPQRAHIASQCITTQFTTNIKVSVKMLFVIQSKRHTKATGLPSFCSFNEFSFALRMRISCTFVAHTEQWLFTCDGKFSWCQRKCCLHFLARFYWFHFIYLVSLLLLLFYFLFRSILLVVLMLMLYRSLVGLKFREWNITLLLEWEFAYMLVCCVLCVCINRRLYALLHCHSFLSPLQYVLCTKIVMNQYLRFMPEQNEEWTINSEPQ